MNETTVLKLYVWEDAFEEYSHSGMVCVLAPDEASAWELLRVEDEHAWRALRAPNALVRPREIAAPEAFVSWGGA